MGVSVAGDISAEGDADNYDYNLFKSPSLFSLRLSPRLTVLNEEMRYCSHLLFTSTYGVHCTALLGLLFNMYRETKLVERLCDIFTNQRLIISVIYFFIIFIK